MKRALWDDPQWRAKTSEAYAAAKRTPAFRAKFSALLRERWKNPAWRRVWLKRQREHAADPEVRAASSVRMQGMWKDPTFKQRITRDALATRQTRLQLLNAVREIADPNGCFSACHVTLAIRAEIKLADVGGHLSALEKRGKIMLAKPAGREPALYQLL